MAARRRSVTRTGPDLALLRTPGPDALVALAIATVTARRRLLVVPVLAAVFAVMVAGCMGNGAVPGDDAAGSPGDLAHLQHDSGGAGDMTKGPPDMTLNPSPMVPNGIPKVLCTGFDPTQAVWGPAPNGSYVRFSHVANRLIARYEDSWNGNADANCYDVTPTTGSLGAFSQGDWPWTYVAISIDSKIYVTKDGWTWHDASIP